jgi:putative addiction module component (TIGR02574 family)
MPSTVIDSRTGRCYSEVQPDIAGNDVILPMTTATQAILKKALNLSPVERAELIEKLFQSFDKAPDKKIDALWAEESEARIDAYDSGQIAADSAKAVFDRINKR